MNERLQAGKLRRLKHHLKDTYSFSIHDLMKILRVGKTRAYYYRNKLLAEGFIDVSHGVGRYTHFKLTRKNNEDQTTTSAV